MNGAVIPAANSSHGHPKDENEYITPAVDGTLRALKAAKKSGIKRVVLTSSITYLPNFHIINIQILIT